MSLMCCFSSKWRLLKPLPLFLQGYSVSLEASFTLSLRRRSPFPGLEALIVNTFLFLGHWFAGPHCRCYIGPAASTSARPFCVESRGLSRRCCSKKWRAHRAWFSKPAVTAAFVVFSFGLTGLF